MMRSISKDGLILAAASLALLTLPWLIAQPASDLPVSDLPVSDLPVSDLPASESPAAALRAKNLSGARAEGRGAASGESALDETRPETRAEPRSETPSETRSETLRLRVVKVTDADTFTGETLDPPGRAVKIRVTEIDAPEKRQPGGLGARQFAEAQLFGHVVRVEATGADRYGRTLGRVTLPDGTDYGEKLVRFGWAWRYDQYSDSARLAELQAEARAKRRGLWKQSDPIPPWEWRKRKR